MTVRPQTLPHQRVGWRLKGEEVSIVNSLLIRRKLYIVIMKEKRVLLSPIW